MSYESSSKYVLIRDIERCPYLPGDSEYERWNEENNARLAEIIKYRKRIHETAMKYMSHTDRDLRNLCIFVDSFFDEE